MRWKTQGPNGRCDLADRRSLFRAHLKKALTANGVSALGPKRIIKPDDRALIPIPKVPEQAGEPEAYPTFVGERNRGHQQDGRKRERAAYQS
jgi:hypothetical protein